MSKLQQSKLQQSQHPFINANHLDDYKLDDRYGRETGRVFLTGTQALVKIPLLQSQLDRRQGKNTAGFITGYRGSPLGGYDHALWQAKAVLEQNRIDFVPGINEELAATMVLGSQQVESDSDKSVDAVFGIWYGKGPGVDRAGDALKHGNTYGSSPNGGVLVIAGDDHGCVSSSMPHQSDVAFMSFFMPTIHPASIEEFLSFGLWGFAMSRFSGMWCGFKAIAETVESAASVELPEFKDFVIPEDFEAPEGGLHYRWPDLPGPQLETRIEHKLAAVAAFARANPIDKKLFDIPNARFGIVTTGKAHLDLMAALQMLGIDEAMARDAGIDIYKVGLVWPLERSGAMGFIEGKREVLVIEEKRGIIESQIKEYMSEHDHPGEVLITGKQDQDGAPLIPYVGELGPNMIAEMLASRLARVLNLNFDAALANIGKCSADVAAVGGVRRLPFFCSGCPHNVSTKVPDGSRAQAGIGCHFMASWMGRKTESLIQMGGEGVNWASKSRFLHQDHIFQNLGEGTYFHSGSLAIRQSLAAGAHITYKILFNDAVAMTGGQPVDGVLTVPGIASQVAGEGISRIAIVSDDIEKWSDHSLFPNGTTFHDRSEMDVLQQELRKVPNVSVLIYDQVCAAEKRRRRKRGLMNEPTKRVFINHHVCEACGDCSQQSNCLSVVPKETEQGVKRQIDQSSCNKDYSCVNGFCPSFVTLVGGDLKKRAGVVFGEHEQQALAQLTAPNIAPLSGVYNLLVGGVGGTGIVTIGALITMAAHLEGKGASVLDFMGFAQKGGTVLSYVRLAPRPSDIYQVRLDEGQADALIMSDMVVGTSEKALRVLRQGHTRGLLNLAQMATADHVIFRDADMQADQRQQTLIDALGKDNLSTLDANRLAESLLGDTVYANVMLFGYAWQMGLIPLSLTAVQKAISLNAVAVENNIAAFNWGRLAVNNLEQLNRAVSSTAPIKSLNLSEQIEANKAYLEKYQNAAYAASYAELIDKVQVAEAALGKTDLQLTKIVARQLMRVMAYKDEYEVARLYTQTDFIEQLRNTFTADAKLQFNFAPPMMGRFIGENKKMVFGGWMFKALGLLAKLKGLRETLLDPFQFSADRCAETRLRDDYIDVITRLCEQVTNDNYTVALSLAELPKDVRGFGHVKAKSLETYYEQQADLLSQGSI